MEGRHYGQIGSLDVSRAWFMAPTTADIWTASFDSNVNRFEELFSAKYLI